MKACKAQSIRIHSFEEKTDIRKCPSLDVLSHTANVRFCPKADIKLLA